MAVTGIGGFFFRADDASALAAWYRTHMGVGLGKYGQWAQAAGPTVFAPFPRDADHFPIDRPYMLNLRVDDLPSMIDDLRKAGIEVTTDPAWDDPTTGRFARVTDPEGNPIELWEPPADD